MSSSRQSPVPPKHSFSWRESKLWKNISDTSTAGTWLQWAVAFFMLWRTQGRLPALGVNPIGAIAASCTIFFGTLFLVSGARKLTASTIPRIKKWHNPPVVLFASQTSNRYAAIELIHYGESITWEAYMRVVEVLGGETIENPFTRQCILQKDGKALRSVLLRHGERADWVIANASRYGGYRGPTMTLQDANSQYSGTSVPSSGVILELELRAVPEWKKGKIRRYFKLSSRYPEIIELTEVERKEIKFTEI